MPSLTIIKVGGAIVEDPASLSSLLDSFASIAGHKVLIHGGGRSATRLAERLGLPQQMIAGRRVTDADTLRVVTMVYGGLISKQIVAALQARGLNALGLTGADLDLVRAHRRPPVKVEVEPSDSLTSNLSPLTSLTSNLSPLTYKEVDYGFVGDVDRVDAAILADLIGRGVVPVVAPLSHDGHGTMLNTNADTMASAVARALAAATDADGRALFDVTLTYCFERSGVMRDADGPDTPANVIPRITAAEFPALVASGVVAGGMLPKLRGAFDAIAAGVARVVITRADAIADPSAGTILSA